MKSNEILDVLFLFLLFGGLIVGYVDLATFFLGLIVINLNDINKKMN